MTNNSPLQSNDLNNTVPLSSDVGQTEQPPQMASEMGGGMERNSPSEPNPPVSENSNQANAPVPDMPYKKPFNFMKMAFIFLIVVLLGVGGYFGYRYLNSKKTSSNKTEGTPTVTVAPESTDNSSSNTTNTEPTAATQSSAVQDGPSEETIDFSKCNAGDGYSRSVPLGSTYLSVIDVDKANNICQIEILNEVEGGFVKYSCKIPETIGALTFSIGNSGSDFSAIMSYCTEIKSAGQ